MKHYARIENRSVVEILAIEDDLDIATLFHADLIETMRPCSGEVLVGWVVAGNALTPPPEAELTEAELANLRVSLINEVNASAEMERKRYITAGEGQALTYSEKRDQAHAFLAASDPDPSDFPIIANEIGITGATAREVAEVIAARAASWKAIGEAIEKVRVVSNKAIADASDADTARAVRAGTVWPTFA